MVAAPIDKATRLKELDQAIERVVLQRQDPISGLLPASTAHTVHGNYGDAWVRDCVYSIQCVWGLAIAHRRQDGEHSRRAWELEQRVLNLMRGLLQAMLRQAEKVERFKHSLDPLDALHAKYDSALGTPVVPDDGWDICNWMPPRCFCCSWPNSPEPAWWWCAAPTKRTSSRT